MEESRWKKDVAKGKECSALLIGHHKKSYEKEECRLNLKELGGLSETYGLNVKEEVSVYLRKIDPGLLLGKGKLEEIKTLADENEIDVIIFDDELFPAQQRNLEKYFKRSVSDRTELILEVFHQRAQTDEAKLQIKLAQIRYQFPRLKRLWTHLSRQRMSGGHLKGEGEKQIEIDKQLLQKQEKKLMEDLKEVRANRSIQRSARLRSATPTFAIVGYTNAGKSSLLKALTQADVFVEDKLFATLDTTTRKFKLPNKQDILLIDTVGFIRKLPHLLVEAFRSTLEEAVYTDVLIHLIDASDPRAELHAETTENVLKELGASKQPIITVLNKIDLVDADDERVEKLRLKYPKSVKISVKTEDGFDEMQESIIKELSAMRIAVKMKLPYKEAALCSEVEKCSNVTFKDYDDEGTIVHAEIPKMLLHKVEKYTFS